MREHHAIDLPALAKALREATDEIEWIDTSLPYQIDVQAWGQLGDTGRGLSWNIQVINPHSPSRYPDVTLSGGIRFNGGLTAGAWAALDVVRAAIGQSALAGDLARIADELGEISDQLGLLFTVDLSSPYMSEWNPHTRDAFAKRSLLQIVGRLTDIADRLRIDRPAARPPGPGDRRRWRA